MNEIHIAFLSCSIGTFSIQAFIVDKRTFEGKWEIPHEGVSHKPGGVNRKGGHERVLQSTNFPPSETIRRSRSKWMGCESEHRQCARKHVRPVQKGERFNQFQLYLPWYNTVHSVSGKFCLGCDAPLTLPFKKQKFHTESLSSFLSGFVDESPKL